MMENKTTHLAAIANQKTREIRLVKLSLENANSASQLNHSSCSHPQKTNSRRPDTHCGRNTHYAIIIVIVAIIMIA